VQHPASTVPDLVPVLSRGRHRNPRKGACFMEMAGFLAGERWSDHPACTHPLLATLARSVNDLISDAGRRRLVPMIPTVVGLDGDDVRIDATIALRCAWIALPVAAAERQTALAVSVLTSERLLAGMDGRESGLSEPSRRALDAAPYAARQAAAMVRDLPMTVRRYRRHSAPATVACATTGVAQACIADPDALLYAMLATAVEDTARLVAARNAQRATSVVRDSRTTVTLT